MGVNMSDTSNLHDRVMSLIAKQLDKEVDSISPEASFVDDLGADSIEIVELVMAIEDEFNITISDDEAEKIVTVKNAIDKITEEANAKAN
tara:strand:- start:23 stop:292 length:270 start_codon:yes stop_codon:yes gene_type:complete